MANVFEYLFKIGGNYSEQIVGMTDATGKFTGELYKTHDTVQRFASILASFDYAKTIAQNTAQGLTELSGAGVKLDSQMHDLSAVAGVTGDGLKQIETFARQSAKAFGTDAAVAVKGSHGARGFHLSEKNALRSKLRSNSSESSTRMSLRISDFNLLASSI